MSVNDGPIFLDTNVVLYAFSEDAAKAERAERLLGERPTLSAHSTDCAQSFQPKARIAST